ERFERGQPVTAIRISEEKKEKKKKKGKKEGKREGKKEGDRKRERKTKKKKNKKKDHRHEGRDARRMPARGRRTARTNLEDEAPEMDLADESRGWIDDDGWRNENVRAGR
ncbi:MAG: hypothetical protein M1815_005988, partial [Lichina confinis]